MQVGEEHLPRAHPVELLSDRLLDLEDEVGLGPYVISAFEYASASRLELVVGNRRSQPGAALHRNVVPVPAELVDSRGVMAGIRGS